MALCDGRGRLVAQLQVPATAAGYARLLAWARAAAQGAPVTWAVEGTRHYGLGLARHLGSQGQQVAEIDASRHVGRRRAGKSDAIDAVRAARELLARPRLGQLRADGDREALRLLMIDRDNAVASAKTARTLLASVLVTAPAPLRERLGRMPRDRRARVCASLACPRRADRQTRVLHQTLARLGQRVIMLARTAAELEKQITVLVEDLAPGLVAAEPGAGALTAAQVLLSFSHAGRIHSEAAFAMLSGTAPVPVSSGRTGRHRSTVSATASSTAPCRSSPSAGCAATRPLRPTSSAAGPRARPTGKSAAASSVTWPATSTAPSPASSISVLRRVDKHRSVRSNAQDRSRTTVLTARLSGHQVMINGHALSPPLSFMAAVPVGPEPRSIAAAVWSCWRRRPRSRNVTGRGATAAPDPPFGADIALMSAGIWLAHIGVFGAE